MAFLSKKTIHLICLAVLFAAIISFNAAAGDVSARPIELKILIDEALANNMGLQAIRARVGALKKEIPAAGALDDPKLGFGLANMPTDTFDFDQEPMTQKQVFVSQRLPWFGKRALRKEMAELMAEKEAVVLEKQRLELARRISGMFYRLWYVDQALDNNRRLRDLLAQAQEVTETGYATGKAQEKDMIQARLEISQIEDQRIVLETERRSLDKDINGLLNRKNFQPIKTPPELPRPAEAIEIEVLEQTLLNSNPQIRIRKIDLQMAELATALADKSFWPDSEWRLTYGQRDRIMHEETADFLSASVMFNVPLWQNRKQTPVRDARQEITKSTRMELDNLLSRLPFELERIAGQMKDLGKSYRFYEDVMITQVSDLARSSMSSYQVGKLAFDVMIRAQIRQLEVELKADKYLQMIYTKLAELNELVGNSATETVKAKDP